MRPAQVRTVSVYGGDPLRLEYRLKVSTAPGAAGVNLSGMQLSAQWVSSKDPSNMIEFDLSESVLATGVIVMRLTKSQTAAMNGHGAFDLQQDGEQGVTIFGGRTIWRAGITND